MWTKNATTGQLELVFQGELLSVSETKLENSKGTEYRVGSVKLPNGKIKSCRIYEKNFAYGMEKNVSYRCTATQYKDEAGNIQVDILMSHLTQAERATVADFDGVDGIESSVKSTIAEQAL